MLVIAGLFWKSVHFTPVGVSLSENAFYLPVMYLDWMQDKNYPVPSERAGRNYHLKAMIAIYLHLQTRSSTHVLTMSWLHICYMNFVLHTEEIYCIIIFVWLLLFDHWAPVKGLHLSLHWLKMLFFIFQDLCHSHCDDATVQKKITAIIDCFINSAIPPALQIDIPTEQAKKILERRKELGPYIFREAQVRSRENHCNRSS